MGENHGEKKRESTITMVITMMFSSLLGFLRSTPFMFEGILYLYRLYML